MSGVYQQGLSELKRKIRAMKDSGVCCMPLSEGLLAIRVQGGKYVWREDIRWADPANPDIGQALTTLRARRPDAKRFSLAVNFPSLSIKKLSMPSMTEAELVSAMSWEEDRLFSVDSALSWQIIIRDDTGFQLLVTGVKKEALSLWQEQARTAGMTLVKAFSVTTINPSEEASLILYGGKKKGILLFAQGAFRETKGLTLSEGSEAISAFLSRMRQRASFESCHAGFIPLSDAGDEEEALWKAMLRDGTAEELTERPLWQTLASMMDRPPETGEKHFYQAALIPGTERRTMPFPIAQGLAAGALVLCIAAGISFMGQYYELSQARDEAARLSPVRKEVALSRKNREEIQRLSGLIQDLNKKYGGWEKRLVTLADSLPEGTVLTCIERDNAQIIVTGTVADDGASTELKNRLSRAWKKEGRLQRKIDPLSRLIRFELSFEQAGEES